MLSNRKKLFPLIFVLILFTSLCAINFVECPNEIKIIKDDNQVLNVKFPLKLNTKSIDQRFLKLVNYESEYGKNKIYVNPLQVGTTKIQVKLLGILPMKEVQVNVIPKIKVIPGGQSVGVKLNTKGVLVVGLEEIKGINGTNYNPGRKAGLFIGDSILKINNIEVKDAQHVIDIINANKGEEMSLKIKRGDKILNSIIMPIKCKDDGEYRMGLWVRDKTAGVGTLTFYHPETKKFGALGHAITDIDTGLLMTVSDGEVVRSKVTAIEQGKRGKPGEIKGIFFNSDNPIGKLQKNTQFGIYGDICDRIDNPLYHQPIEIGFQNEIKEGKATILTTTDNNKTQSYEIYIKKINHQRIPTTKSMVIQVTDQRLLEKSGGIVQGMSGSPIIQNGKLVGAVTHVFVNDPTKGYGLFIEWMINEAGIDVYNDHEMTNND